MSGAPGASADRLFEDAFAARPEGIWSAPGRVNLIGEFTDVNDGLVLPIALPLRTTVAVSRSNGRLLRLTSAIGGSVERAEVLLDGSVRRAELPWTSYVSGVVRSLRDAGLEIAGADIAIASDVPAGAGLSSSAALESAVALALNELYELGLERLQLARIARRAENVYVGVPSGIMDQAASLCALKDRAVFLDTRSEEIELVLFDPGAHGLTLLVIDTRVRHELASSAYAERVRECGQAADLLGVRSLREAGVSSLDALPETIGKRARHVLAENDRVLDVVQLLRAGQVDRIGPTLTTGHASLRDDFEVSSEELDVAVDAALGAGALGARMTGGGFGGCAICLVDEGNIGTVEANVAEAFHRRALAPPGFIAAPASDGAARHR